VPRYERLRAGALGALQPWGWGWVLFLRDGMWAWCQACGEPLQAVHAKFSGTPRRLFNTADAQLIQILAGMVLAVQQEVDHDD
jgi:hypothetical protein